MNLFFKGLILGLSIAAPVGPIGILCIRQSLGEGRGMGFVTGLGAATADAAYGAVAAFGLTAVSGFLVGQRFWLGLIGGIFLCGLGARTFFSKPAAVPESGKAQMDRHSVAGATPRDDQPGRWLAAYGSTLLLTLTNPMTILSFTAVFAGFGLGTTPDFGAAGALVAGVFLGSASWWLLLSTTASLLRRRVTPIWMKHVRQTSGVVIFVFGIYALAGLR